MKGKTDYEELEPITGELLANMFREDKFRSLLRRSAMHLMKTGHEVGFKVYRDIEDKLHYSQLKKGLTDQVRLNQPDTLPNALQLERKFGPRFQYLSLGVYEIFNLHFHPLPDTPPVPSLGDLKSLRRSRHTSRCIVDYNPVSAIGVMDLEKKGDLLLIQENAASPLLGERDIDEDYQGICELHVRSGSVDGVVRALNDTGVYKSTNMKFALANNRLVIPDSELNKLAIFAYTPKLYNEF